MKTTWDDQCIVSKLLAKENIDILDTTKIDIFINSIFLQKCLKYI